MHANLNAVGHEETGVWSRLHARAARRRDAHWARLHPHERGAYIAHDGAFKRDALRWEHAQGRLPGHAARARESLQKQHLLRTRGWDAALQDLHDGRCVSALRAVSNLGGERSHPAHATHARHPAHAAHLSGWLSHRDESVQVRLETVPAERPQSGRGAVATIQTTGHRLRRPVVAPCAPRPARSACASRIRY